MDEGINPAIAVVLVIAVVWAVYTFWLKPEVWTGIVYPSASNLLIFERIGDFESLDDCLSEAISKVNTFVEPSAADYECGLNCRPSDFDPELMICEETRDYQ